MRCVALEIGMNHLIMAHIDDDSQKPQIKEWLKKSHSTAGYLLFAFASSLLMAMPSPVPLIPFGYVEAPGRKGGYPERTSAGGCID